MTTAPEYQSWGSSGPGALDIRGSMQRAAQDDEEEWEYEYSTTDTETYYLTLDLSYPEFKEPATRVARHSRGGYYKNWLDGATTRYPKGPASAAHTGKADDQNMNELDANEEDPEIEREEVEDDEEGEPDAAPTSWDKGKGVDRGEDAQEGNYDDPQNHADGEEAQADEPGQDIQILDLHSPKPIISYRGRVFEGSWAEVIGSEAILTSTQDGPVLPALRNLGGGVDFLAASASRIMTTEKNLEPKGGQGDTLEPIKAEWNIRVPTGKDRTGEKRHQTNFLENLMALKKKKGEKDQVTVWALDGQGKDFRDDKGLDFKPRGKRVGGMFDTGKPRGPRRRGGRPKGSRARSTAPMVVATSSSYGHEQFDTGGLSTPTPAHWENLHRQSMEQSDDNDDGTGSQGNG